MCLVNGGLELHDSRKEYLGQPVGHRMQRRPSLGLKDDPGLKFM